MSPWQLLVIRVNGSPGNMVDGAPHLCRGGSFRRFWRTVGPRTPMHSATLVPIHLDEIRRSAPCRPASRPALFAAQAVRVEIARQVQHAGLADARRQATAPWELSGP